MRMVCLKDNSLKIIALYCFLTILVPAAVASDFKLSCSNIKAKVIDSSEVSFVTDVCPVAEKCKLRDEASQKFDYSIPGRFVYEGPESRLKIVSSSGEPGCPKSGSIFVAFAAIPAEYISANLSCSAEAESSKGRMRCEFRQIRPVDSNNWVGIATAVGEKLTDCFPKGAAVGSGMPDACCEGLKEIAATDPISCERMAGGYYCAACGNGVCEAPENRCNCSEDCRI